MITKMEKILFIASILIATVLAGHEGGGHEYEVHEVQKEHIPILSFHNDNDKHGQYSYSFKGGNGIEQSEEGKAGHSASGSYSYFSPEGKLVALSYTAGKGGFQVLHQTPQLEQNVQRPDQYHVHNGWAHNTYHVAPAKSGGAAEYYHSIDGFGSSGSGGDGKY